MWNFMAKGDPAYSEKLLVLIVVMIAGLPFSRKNRRGREQPLHAFILGILICSALAGMYVFLLESLTSWLAIATCVVIWIFAVVLFGRKDY
jgi:hypothetical protein